MNHIIEEITLGEGVENYDIEASGEKPARLERLAKINIFVGENNSGKSRLIRAIARRQNNIYEPRKSVLFKNIPVRHFEKIADLLATDLERRLGPLAISDVNNATIRLKEAAAKLNAQGLTQNTSTLNPFFNLIKQLTSERIETWAMRGQVLRGNNKPAQEILHQWAKDTAAALHPLQQIEEQGRNLKYTYIPTLRSLRLLDGKDSFKSRTEEDYQLSGHVNVYTGQSLYADIERLLRGTLTDRNTLRKYEEWLSASFFNGKPTA